MLDISGGAIIIRRYKLHLLIRKENPASGLIWLTWASVLKLSNSSCTTRRGILPYVVRSRGCPVKLTAVFQKVPEGYLGFVEELPGANAQGATLDEVRENLAEAVALVLEANRVLSEETIQGEDVIREPLVISAG